MYTQEEIKNGNWKMKVSPEEFRKVESCVIDNGGGWWVYANGKKKYEGKESPFLFLDNFSLLACEKKSYFFEEFKESARKEISVNDFFSAMNLQKLEIPNQQKKLDVKFTREGPTVTAKILHQDESLRCPYNYDHLFIIEKGSYYLKSNILPYIYKDSFFVRGRDKEMDNLSLDYIFDSEEKAIEWLENIQAMVDEINGETDIIKPTLGHATVNETLDHYRIEDKNTLKKPFWYCYIPESGAPHFKHDSYDSALQEAKRLEANTGKDVQVLKCESIVHHEYTNIEKCELIAKAREKGACVSAIKKVEDFLHENKLPDLTIDVLFGIFSFEDIKWLVDNLGIKIPEYIFHKYSYKIKKCKKCNLINFHDRSSCVNCNYVF